MSLQLSQAKGTFFSSFVSLLIIIRYILIKNNAKVKKTKKRNKKFHSALNIKL